MPYKSKTLHKSFLIKVNSLKQVRINFENAYNSKHIDQTDILQAYSGLYLDLFTEFEALIEDLFIGLLTGNVLHVNSSIKTTIKIKPVSQVRNVIVGINKRYIDWLPFADRTMSLANFYFLNGNPFSFLSVPQQNQLKNYHTIRNAIAHKSSHSIDMFKKIISSLTLLPIERTPSGYLRSIPNPTTGLTQLEIAFDELINMSNTLCN